MEGKWDVVLGIVKIGPDCRVDVTIRVVSRQARWLSGDIHSHTEHSDGGVPVADAVHRARVSRLDFVALTDHNTTTQNWVKLDDPGLLVIPGMELTSYYGHTNFLGLKDPVADWRCTSPGEVATKMAEAREKGATIVINHPFQRSAGGRWQSGYDLAFDAIEIWNGNWSELNQDALDMWQRMLSAGQVVPATGGSDFHLKNRRRHGRPCNRLYAAGYSVADVLSALKAGRNVISFAPQEVQAEPVDRDGPIFGDTLAVGSPIAVRFAGLGPGDDIRLITEKGRCRDMAGRRAGHHADRQAPRRPLCAFRGLERPRAEAVHQPLLRQVGADISGAVGKSAPFSGSAGFFFRANFSCPSPPVR
ncbi:CehA/McbA family metallohydrolase [Roseibium salinum]|nr:CehA/McbA family metallohydrolase [Roseibium salinum]